MLSELKLHNFRGFDRHSLPLRETSIIVGRNNAGKSTVVEALRLISVVTERLTGLNFREPPLWTELPKRHRGVSPSLSDLGIDFTAICHRYRDPPARVTASFEGGESIDFHVHNTGDGFAVVRDPSGSVVTHKGTARDLDFPQVHILPQVAPLEKDEKILASEDYVRRNLSSPLAPRHFRNQLRILRGEYRNFRRIAEETWPGLQIRTLQGARGLPGDTLSLMVRDRDFVAEVGLMGHGLQMWLQTMWFLARTPEQTSVVLDEPDVYMHPDLQRKMVRIVKDRFDQVLIATHSIEIMAEVNPSDILVIDRKRRRSDFVDSPPELQSLIDRLGGLLNIHLARLWDARRCLFVEGNDLGILQLFHDLIAPDSRIPIDDIPNTSIGGWGGWNYAVGSSIFIRNAVGEEVQVYCLLDSDYHTQASIAERYEDAERKDVHLHIWNRKELENYALVPNAITRVIARRTGGNAPEHSDIVKKIDQIAEGLRKDIFDSYATELLGEYGADKLKQSNREARSIVDDYFDSYDGRIALVSGKEVIGRLSEWSQQHYGASFGVMTVAREIRAEEVAEEVRAVLKRIDDGKEITRALREEFTVIN